MTTGAGLGPPSGIGLIGHYAALLTHPSRTLTPIPQCDKPRRNCESGDRGPMRYSGCMASEQDDSPEFDRLARRYLDLWQNQLSGLAADQALTEQIARLFAAANAQLASMLQAAQGSPSCRNRAWDRDRCPCIWARP